jgi:hypothetical protein
LSLEVNDGAQKNTTNHKKAIHHKLKDTQPNSPLQSSRPILMGNSPQQNQHAAMQDSRLRKQGKTRRRKTTAYTNLGTTNPIDKKVTEI